MSYLSNLLLCGKNLKCLMDNTATMFCVNWQGGVHSSQLCQEAVLLWEFCITNSIHLKAAYLQGEQNILTGHLSRSVSAHHKWSLHLHMARSVFQLWVTPQVDLFATENAICSAPGRWEAVSQFRFVGWCVDAIIGPTPCFACRSSNTITTQSSEDIQEVLLNSRKPSIGVLTWPNERDISVEKR